MRFIPEHGGLLLLGPPGTGKRHIALSLTVAAIQAIQAGRAIAACAANVAICRTSACRQAAARGSCALEGKLRMSALRRRVRSCVLNHAAVSAASLHAAERTLH